MEQLDTSVGELQLSYYVLNFLRDDEAALDLGRAVTNNVRLKHIESLWGILDDVTLLGVDPFAKTDKKYKMPRWRRRQRRRRWRRRPGAA